jgi:hypothetical protein
MKIREQFGIDPKEANAFGLGTRYAAGTSRELPGGSTGCAVGRACGGFEMSCGG